MLDIDFWVLTIWEYDSLFSSSYCFYWEICFQFMQHLHVICLLSLAAFKSSMYLILHSFSKMWIFQIVCNFLWFWYVWVAVFQQSWKILSIPSSNIAFFSIHLNCNSNFSFHSFGNICERRIHIHWLHFLSKYHYLLLCILIFSYHTKTDFFKLFIYSCSLNPFFSLSSVSL